MVVVKVRETYDLHTTQNKMTVIGIHTPKPDLIKRSYPGLLMQCKAYRPVSCDVRIACASMLPLDPLGVGTSAGSIAPEDVFNPILYKAMSNFGMSQLEARINAFQVSDADVNGDTAMVDVDSFLGGNDDFACYYGLLSNTNDWKHANPQQGLSMTGLRPLVYEVLYSNGDNVGDGNTDPIYSAAPDADGFKQLYSKQTVIGNAKPLPMINCLSYTLSESKASDPDTYAFAGFPSTSDHPDMIGNCSVDVPWIKCYVGAVIIPPSKLHSLFFRMVIEWDLEFSMIRPIQEITSFARLANVGATTHYQNYSYETTKEAITGDSDSILEGDNCMVSANVDINKVM